MPDEPSPEDAMPEDPMPEDPPLELLSSPPLELPLPLLLVPGWLCELLHPAMISMAKTSEDQEAIAEHMALVLRALARESRMLLDDLAGSRYGDRKSTNPSPWVGEAKVTTGIAAATSCATVDGPPAPIGLFSTREACAGQRRASFSATSIRSHTPIQASLVGAANG
jgi:hypothetical protein